ncbi:ATP-binding protein [Spartinivicinus ruber]|uniref:ATP-binding protein n=1 Tax=Spartinivicinus ruber TaxID=2683272 RepID=UPI0013D253B8|nr:ATP-binding protein [Spartinivicinus ruber]
MSSSANESPYYYAWSQLKNWRFVFTLIFSFSCLALLISWYIFHLQSQLVKSSAISSASLYSQALKEFRSLYTSEVVTIAQQRGLIVTHNYKVVQHAIPLPATLSILLGERIGMHENGAKVRLYSPYPFPWRIKKAFVSDDYSQQAWQYLRQFPNQPFYRFEQLNKQEVIRYATADIMQAGCINCHNTHPSSPKTDWQTGDVRGVLEIILPMEKAISTANKNLQGITLLLTTIGILAALAITIVINKLRSNSLHLKQLVDDRTQELANARDQALEASKAKSLFLANMSHEIRTPMNAVLGYAQILDQEPQLAKEHHDAVTCILKAGNHLMEIINDILDLSKIEANAIKLNTHSFLFDDLLKNLAMMFKMRCQNKGIHWQLDYLGEDDLAVMGDEGKIRQVLINLIGNAVKFTDQGAVTLKVVCQENDEIYFEVSDTGPGITNNQEDIFSSFQQGTAGYNKGGTGLGLTIAKKQVGIMGGSLEYTSIPNQLTRFFFSLTLPKATNYQVVQTSTRQIKHLKAGYSVNAMIVDDVADNRMVLVKLLMNIGVQTLEATNGLETLSALQHHHPDIIFLDINMPVMNGIETLNQIQTTESLQDIKVVAVSAASLHHDPAFYLGKGFHQYIAKPYKVSEIYNCLSELLNVKFEYSANNQPPTDTLEQPVNIDSLNVTLPASVYQRLLKAAELYRISEVKLCLEEIAKLDESYQPLVSEINHYVSQYDMTGLIQLIQSVHHD